VEAQAPNSKKKTLLCVALGLSTWALYLPSIRFDFLGYDDQQYVTENPHIRAGLTARGLVWAFGYHAGNWHPLTWISHMLDCQAYGLHPAGHHLTNVLLHTATTVLLFLVLSRMTGTLWRSAAVAALFGWHPLHVESVAWVAERKDVLSGFFFMLTLGAYAGYVTRVERNKEVQSRLFWYFISFFFFALGLMSKPMVVTLPFVLLLLDYWPLKRFQLPIANNKLLFRLFLEKVPFLLLAAIACVLTVMAQTRAHAVVSTAGLPIPNRIAHALISYVHYLSAMFFPRHLAVYYPYGTVTSIAKIIAAVVVLGLISAVAIRFARGSPYLLVGWLWFLGTLVPVIGLVQVGEQAWADRYTYLPGIGIFMAVVWAVAGKLQAPNPKLQRTSKPQIPNHEFEAVPAHFGFGAAMVALIGVGLLALTSVQLRYWKNTRTLFEHAATVTRDNYMAATLLGSLYAKEGKLDEAIDRYKTALGWKRGYPEAHFFLGNALDQQGKIDAAIAEYKQALWFKPMQEQTHIFLGAALAKQRKFDDATFHYLAALNLNPESAVAHNNLARVLQSEGRSDEAMEHYSAALKFDPGLAQAHNNFGVLLLARGKTAEGVRELREALQLNPGDLETESNLALALNQQQQWSEAAEWFGKALEKRSNDANAQYQFAVALVHLRRIREAMSHYASALLIQADYPDALDGLAWILATDLNPTFRNGTEAVRMAERACELTNRKDAQKLKTLAATYAEVGRFNEAASTIQNALDISPLKTKEMQTMAEAFKAGKPWRDAEIK